MSSDTKSKCFSDAAAALKGPPGYFTSGAFSNQRWTIVGDQRDERMRLFGRKLLARLDGMEMPFYPKVGLMTRRVAQQRYVTGVDPWKPMENPYLDGEAIEFAHCILSKLDARQWVLFAEVGFDVGRLAGIAVMWGGFAIPAQPGVWRVYNGHEPDGWKACGRTYGTRRKAVLEYELDQPGRQP